MTTADVLTEIRKQTNDQSTVRWADSVIYGYMTSGQRAIIDQHPEALCTDDSVSVETSPTDIAVNVNPAIDNRYKMALVHYCCSKMFAEDASDLANRRLASDHWDLFRVEMEG